MAAEGRRNFNSNSRKRGCHGLERKRHGHGKGNSKCFVNNDGNCLPRARQGQRKPRELTPRRFFQKFLPLQLPYPCPFRSNPQHPRSPLLQL
jgi:hypothetical protein